MTPPPGRVLVAGSINRDLVLDVPAFPAPGETLLAVALRRSGGGKGANQAVAAAQCGATVVLVGCVGRDADGLALTRELDAAGIDVSRVDHVEASTGTAVVTVDPAGENTIVVATGANQACAEPYVTRSLHDVARSDVVLTQAEIPLDGLRAAVRAAAKAEARLVVNLAPATTHHLDLPPRSVLIVNEHEARSVARLIRSKVADDLSAIAEHFDATLVVTRGALGVVLVDGPNMVSFPAVSPRRLVNTTGAGDSFVGAFAAALAAGHELDTAARWGAAAGSIAVESYDARSSVLDLASILDRVEHGSSTD